MRSCRSAPTIKCCSCAGHFWAVEIGSKTKQTFLLLLFIFVFTIQIFIKNHWKIIWDEGNVSRQKTATPKANVLLKHLKPRRSLVPRWAFADFVLIYFDLFFFLFSFLWFTFALPPEKFCCCTVWWCSGDYYFNSGQTRSHATVDLKKPVIILCCCCWWYTLPGFSPVP